MAIGTGRTLKAAIEQLPPMECPQHKIVSLTGNIAPDGSAAYLQRHLQHGRRGEGAQLPDAAAGDRLLGRGARAAAWPADGARDAGARRARPTSPSSASAISGPRRRSTSTASSPKAELKALQKAGAVGEIVGWAFDAQGRMIDGLDQRARRERADAVARRVAGRGTCQGQAQDSRRSGLRLIGRLINGLITDEATAELLLSALSNKYLVKSIG